MTDKEAKQERRAVRAQLSRSIDKYRAVWPMVVSALLGWALLLLFFFLPFCTVTFRGVTTDYTLLKLVLGHFAGGKSNYWLACFSALLVFAPVIPLFSRRQSYASLIVSDIVEAVGIIGILVGFRHQVIARSFLGTITLEPVYDHLGFILPLVLLTLYLGVPFLARAISTGIATRRFDRSVKAGKKLLNY